MAETRVQAPGTFCWCDLSTPDIKAAKSFYAKLFGWTLEDVPAAEAGTYTMIRLGDAEVGGMSQMSDDMKAQGVPPNWLAYVMVESADKMTAKAKKEGGSVVMGPFDVMDVGRMSVIQDPTGATFALWEAKSHHGATTMGVPGTACWFECISTDKAESGAFYAALFGWELESFPGSADYTLFKQGDTTTGGLMQRTKAMGDAPSHWMINFAVKDCDASARKARELGARIVHPPTDVPDVGRFAILCDPTGAMFSILTLDPTP
jgi:predicted enzyme related to lactoylglutathione lyase